MLKLRTGEEMLPKRKVSYASKVFFSFNDFSLRNKRFRTWKKIRTAYQEKFQHEIEFQLDKHNVDAQQNSIQIRPGKYEVG